MILKHVKDIPITTTTEIYKARCGCVVTKRYCANDETTFEQIDKRARYSHKPCFKHSDKYGHVRGLKKPPRGLTLDSDVGIV